MKKNALSMIIMLLAGIIVTIFGTINKYETFRFTFTLLITLIIFFIVGQLFQIFLYTSIKKGEDESIQEEILEDGNNEEENEQVNDGHSEE